VVLLLLLLLQSLKIRKIQIKVKNLHHLIKQAQNLQNHAVQAEVVVGVAEAHQGRQEEDVEVVAGHLEEEEVQRLNQQLYM